MLTASARTVSGKTIRGLSRRFPRQAPYVSNGLIIGVSSLLAQTNGRVDGRIVQLAKPGKQFRIDVRIARKTRTKLRRFAGDTGHQHLIGGGHGQFRGEPRVCRRFLGRGILLFGILLFRFVLRLAR